MYDDGYACGSSGRYEFQGCHFPTTTATPTTTAIAIPDTPECNWHSTRSGYATYPTDTCQVFAVYDDTDYVYAGYKYECNNDETLTLKTYTTNDCSGAVMETQTFETQGDGGIYWECSYDEICDYLEVGWYTANADCTDKESNSDYFIL